MRKPVKCIVMGCLNHSDGGQMIGELCAPCHEMLTTGKVHHTNSTFIGVLFRDLRNAITRAHHDLLMRIEENLK
jgi:hypothetical protein